MTDTGDLFGEPAPPPLAAKRVNRTVDDVVTYRGGGRKEEKPPAPLVVKDPYPCSIAGCGSHGTWGKQGSRWCNTHRPDDYWTT